MTFDINFKNNDFVRQADEARRFQVNFFLWVRKWDEYKPVAELEWQVVPYSDEYAEKIPNKPGVYAFCVEPRILPGLQPAYLMYIGQTKHLMKRFKQYCSEAKNYENSRPKIYMMLNRYRSHLHFYYATVTSETSPEVVEATLLKALIPPQNTRLPAEVRKIISLL